MGPDTLVLYLFLSLLQFIHPYCFEGSWAALIQLEINVEVLDSTSTTYKAYENTFDEECISVFFRYKNSRTWPLVEDLNFLPDYYTCNEIIMSLNKERLFQQSQLPYYECRPADHLYIEENLESINSLIYGWNRLSNAQCGYSIMLRRDYLHDYQEFMGEQYLIYTPPVSIYWRYPRIPD